MKTYSKFLFLIYFYPETLTDYFQRSNNRDISILHLNTGSLKKLFDDFKSFLSDLNYTFKIICLSETWLHDAKHTRSKIQSE